MRYIGDTNIAIYYLQLQLPAKAELFIDESLQEGAPFISAMTEIELLCWKSFLDHTVSHLLTILLLVHRF